MPIWYSLHVEVLWIHCIYSRKLDTCIELMTKMK